MNNILVVSSRFYKEISKELEKEAVEVLKNNNFKYEVISVPGAFEVPAVISEAVKYKKYQGYVALGCVIRGETSHYDYVCTESARALMNLSLKGIPIGYGILTCETKEQAKVRASSNGLNKGKAAATACINMLSVLTELKK